MKNHNKYIHTLKSSPFGTPFYYAGNKLLNEHKSLLNDAEKIIIQSVSDVIGPVLISYCIWIIQKARKSGLQKLYFLARDGKILMEICKVLIQHYKLDIECKYLYVSRYSLRKALFSINPDEALRYICRNSLSVTPASILQRSGLSSNIQQQVLLELGYSTESQQSIPLTPKELDSFYLMLKESKLFCSEMQAMSEEYNTIIYEYFQEQGIANGTHIAIVDSGWTGSIQRCIRQILSYNKVNASIEGFYFGIQSLPKREDGIYNWFYFGPQNYYEYIHFNNNLFECWCMADHGMTIGYQKNNNEVVPILNKHAPQHYAIIQSDALKQYALFFTEYQHDLQSIPIEQLTSLVRPLLIRFMTHPDRDEATVYGSIPFCDDTTEMHLCPLAAPLSMLDLCKNLTIIKCINKILKPVKQIAIRESGWREGTIANLPLPMNWIMYIDSQLSYFVKMIAYKH